MTSVAAALISKQRKMDETGKRSGVTVNFGDQPVPLRDDGMEDEDAFFDAARSPESSEINGKGNNNKENSESENDDDKKEPAKKRTKKIRFSLSSDAGSTQGRGTAAAKAKNAARKLISNGGRVSLDPSEISGVTTAPPSAEKSVENVREDDVVEEEVAVGKHGLGGSPVDGFAVADDNDDDGFPITQDDDDDEDLVPPPPPEAEPTEEEEAFPAPDDDDDNEGPGFDMADNDVSGVDGSPVQSNKKSSKKKKKTRDDSTDEDSEDSMPVKKDKKQKKKRKKGQVSDGEEESVKTAPRKKAKKKKSRFATTFSPKGVPLPRQYKVVPISDLKCNSPEDPNLRRSRRHRYKPLEFWRGEVIEFGPTDEFDEDDFDSLQNMPVPKAIKMAEPTPYKPRKVIEREPTKGKKSKKTGGRSTAYVEQGESVEDKEFDSSKLRKKYTYNDGDEAYLWDDCVEESTELKVVCYADQLVERALPLGKNRSKSDGKVVGRAAQAFHVMNEESSVYPGYLMGNLILPPKGIKDAEAVGGCSQTFTVVSGQKKAVEIAYGDPDNMNGLVEPKTAQRFLLSKGDMFRIPPGNCYRLQNHSKEVDCLLTWTIIRANPEDDE